MSKTNLQVDGYFRNVDKWREELQKLRTIVLDCELTEELKWGCPCYTLEKRNIVLIHAFKEYCALLFFKGALMKDPSGILIQQTKNVQAARQIRFANVREIVSAGPSCGATFTKPSRSNNRAGKSASRKSPNKRCRKNFRTGLMTMRP